MSSETKIHFQRPIRKLKCGSKVIECSPQPQNQEMERLRKELEKKEARIEELEAEKKENEEQREKQARWMEQLLDELETILEGARKQQAEMIEENEEEMVDLCLQLTEKVLQHEIDHGSYKIGEIIDGALQRIRETSEVHVHVNPEDYEAATSALELLKEQRGIDGLQAVKDPDIEPASCRIETESGTVVSEAKKRLEKIEQELLKQGASEDA